MELNPMKREFPGAASRRLAAARALLLAACLSGCAAYQVNLRPLRGVPLDAADALRSGELAVPADRLFEAAAAALEHEPYFHWDIQTLDTQDGFLKASAGFMREVQIRVSAAGEGRSRLSVSVPRRALKTRAKIWVKKDDPSSRTAYEPDPSQRAAYAVYSAEVELDDAYFYSFVYHVLHDGSEVPFDLAALQPGPPPGGPPQPVSVDQAPAAASKGLDGSPAAAPLSPTAAAAPTSPTAAAPGAAAAGK